MEEKIRESLEDNRRILESIFGDCADVTLRTVMMGTNVRGLAIFMEPTAGDLYGLSQMLLSFLGQSREEVQSRIRAGQLGLVDACTLDDFSQAVAGFFAGDVILFADGVAKAVKIPAKGYPGLGVVKADAEKGLRGSDESFSDSVKINASLIRKRIKSPKLKLKEYEVGERTKTRIYLLYIEDLVEKELLYLAFTALCTFCVPNEELAQAYRLINVGVLVLCAVLGPVGLFMGMLWVTLRLASLTSLGYPFWRKMNDTFVVPATMRRLRGLFARRQNPVRLRKKG